VSDVAESTDGPDDDASTVDADATTIDAAEAGEAGNTTDAAACPVMLGATLPFQSTFAPFPGTKHPDVLVHIPPGFDACARPGLVVVFHGFDNCVTNVVGATDSPCTPDGGARAAANLAGQHDKARVNALLFAVQLQFDAPTGDPGQLAVAGDFQSLVKDVLHALGPSLGRPIAVADLDRVVVASLSGGYEAAGRAVAVGGLGLQEVDLYDSLFGETPTFAGWIAANAHHFDASQEGGTRFVDLYTLAGGTLMASQGLAATTAATLADAGMATAMNDQRDGGPVDLSAPVVFALVSGSHDDVPRSYFGAVLAAAKFAPL
jgi:hypothetical protein